MANWHSNIQRLDLLSYNLYAIKKSEHFTTRQCSFLRLNTEQYLDPHCTSIWIALSKFLEELFVSIWLFFCHFFNTYLPVSPLTLQKLATKTLVNTLTWYCYSSKIPRSVNYLCMNLCKITPKYLLWPQFKYLHFRRIWQILVKAKRISSNYSCFSPFVVQSRIIIRFWCM